MQPMWPERPAIVVHGGAGQVEPERFDRLREGVRAAAAAGYAILAAGGGALDAVVAAVRVLEDDPEFNAGTGSVLTRDGTVETDAAVMDGATRRIGAVAAVPDLGNAVALARAVLEADEHVLLAGPAAWRFAVEHGIAPAPAGSLVTERARARLAAIVPGTVGAVARDGACRFAAATSTGGTNGKRAGRVGDSPLPGSGTWADERCAVSATGHGESIIRCALAHRIAMAIERGADPRAACLAALAELRALTGHDAGVIALDGHGWSGIQLSRTMPVAWIDGDGRGANLGDRVAP